MNIAIIGGGITGLSAAWELSKTGHKVTVFEAAPVLGGLAYGFKQKDWDWHLEYAYHHLFTNDYAILDLLKELNVTTITKRPITANLTPSGAIVPLDSPIHLFKFPGLTFSDKIRTGFLLAFLKINPFWRPLEYFTAEQLLCSIGGRHAYQVLWEPLLVGKFSHYSDKVSAAWFWARIKKRTPSLVYIKGGFQTFITTLETAIKKNGGKIYAGTSVNEIQRANDTFMVNDTEFDNILLTTPTPIAEKLLSSLPSTFYPLPSKIPHLWAQTLILETDKPILDKTYWLNVTDRSFPFLAVVAHTNFMDKSHYGGHHLTYIGNYLPQGHTYLSMNKEELLKEFMPYIKRLCPTINDKLITNTFLFTGPFAQPVHELHYSRRAPKLLTGIPGAYLANMDSIYPWDRGTNYAVELGIKAAKKIIEI